MKRKFGIVKGIISYILALMMTIVFALFLNASVGWFMLIALILAPILSVFFAFITKHGVKLFFSMPEVKLSKGDSCEMTITLKNTTIFPTTPIEIGILNGEGVFSTEKGIITTIMPLSQKTIRVSFDAEICGKSKVGIKDVVISDYLGIFSFKSKTINEKELNQSISVIPDIMKVSPKDDRILKVMQDSLNAEDSEDTKESVVSNFGGFPGYDKRDYVPGDPIKRINWKQSAKRNKLLVRLDDEMNANGVNIVLDGYFEGHENGALIKQDAVEMALGIISTLILSDYNVRFYARLEDGFSVRNIEDEKDIEEVRMELASYAFSERIEHRFPSVDMLPMEESFVFVSPNSSARNSFGMNVSVFSSMDEFEAVAKETVEEKPKKHFWNQILPYSLASILSIIVFDAFDVKVLSGWTVVQLVVVFGLFCLCNFARKHKFLGFLSVTGTVVISIALAGNFMTPASSFVEWFLSGGDNYNGGISYLLVLICFLTLFFALVIYYYSLIQYRTSALMLISMIAFLVHIKLVKDVKIIQVMIVVVLNVATFLMNNRRKRDEEKRKNTRISYILSMALYSVMFIFLAYAIPKSDDTKYYSEFEDRFLGGNAETEIPGEYTMPSQVSGNADDMKSLNTRKLYAITGLDKPMTIYLHGTTYDYYDYKENHWVIFDDNFEKGYKYKNWAGTYRDIELNQGKLVEALAKAEEYSPGLIEKYGLADLLAAGIVDTKYYAEVVAYNYPSQIYVFPIRGKIYGNKDVFMTKNGDFLNDGGALPRDNIYKIEFYYDFENINEWTKNGGANFTLNESYLMLQDVADILADNNEKELKEVVIDYCTATSFAFSYMESYQKLNDDIPEEVRALAEDITRECTYDWEKAQALMMYFSKGFKYQLGYDAPDDSVEYFLFEGKTGTCSDYAAAYVLMARSVGLCARYVEGFATDNAKDTLDGGVEHIVRASDAHAYAEVFIPNYGYAVYDPTLGEVMESLIPEEEIPANAVVVTYVLTLGARIVIIFAAVSILLLIIILIVKVITPGIKEKRFIKQVKRATLGKGAVMLYLKLLDKCPLVAENVKSKTPYEFADEFLKATGYDISQLVLVVEKFKYQEKDLDAMFKEAGGPILIVYKNATKEYKIALRREKSIFI